MYYRLDKDIVSILNILKSIIIVKFYKKITLLYFNSPILNIFPYMFCGTLSSYPYLSTLNYLGVGYMPHLLINTLV